jgi:hypothetical protein
MMANEDDVKKLQRKVRKLESIIEDYQELRWIFDVSECLTTTKLAMFLLRHNVNCRRVYFHEGYKDYKIDDFFIDDNNDLIFELKEI